mgnify:CR=1 FL=1|tara:strand:+ start:6842 stop:7813 length:972 start_codon:yes stop_codon:yes gene_type:complete
MEIIENKNFEKIYKKEFQEFINNNISDIYHEIILTGPSTGNRNFVITENGKLIAIVPLNFEKKNNSNLVGSFFDLSIPGPIFVKNLELKKFKKIIKLVISEIDKKCLQNNISEIKINFSDLIKFNTGSQEYYILLEVLSNYGFTNKSFIGLRINLDKTNEEIIKDCSKGHKSEIKKQLNCTYIFETYQDDKIGFDDFKDMVKEQVDIEDYCEPLYNLFLQNKIFLSYLTGPEKIFCSIFSVAGNSVEYFVDTMSSTNHHSLIIAAAKYFKSLKRFKYLNFGIVNYLENKTLSESKKKQNISIFKKGFGGEKYLLSIFQKQYFK